MPGIGLTPVGSFLVLIALFVVLIGPVNYYLLRRWRRLYLLLVTVPAGAALRDAALFAYALICDGLGVRVRVRGLIEIDQRVGRTVSWSRQSYYAGLAPSQGLASPNGRPCIRSSCSPMERRWRFATPVRQWSGRRTRIWSAGYLSFPVDRRNCW